MGLLKFDFEKANVQIQELAEISAEIDKVASVEFEEVMQQLRQAWKGSAADAYMKKASKVQKKIKKAATDVQKTSESYTRAVKRVQAAEEKAKEIVGKRN